MMLSTWLVFALFAFLVHCRDAVLHNNKLFVDGTEFFIKGVNYNPTPLGLASMGGDGYGGGGYCSAKYTPYGEWKSACFDSDYFDGGADYWARWPPGPADGFAAIWRRDFPLIQAMGVNTLRLYNTNPTTRAMSQLYSHIIPFAQGKDHVPFLDMAQQYGFHVVYPLYSDMWAFTNTPEDQYKRFLRAQIDEVGNHSAVMLWQFGNEMNWDLATWTIGFYPYPNLMAKYNAYAQYIRQYTLSRWGRKIPITHAVVDFPYSFDWLMQRFDTDIFSLNTFRGSSTGSMFPGDSSTTGFKYGTCAWNKPLLITEYGWPGYYAGLVNQMLGDFVSHINEGLIGAMLFEYNDENVPQKYEDQRFFGAVATSVTYTETQDSSQPDAFIVDTVTPKQLYYDVSSGQWDNKAYNYHSDFYELAGRSAQSLSSSVDYCASVGTFYECPGGYPACNGHGLCDRTTGLCACSEGWQGADCSTAVCPGSPSCNGRGSCSTLTSPPQCVCNTDFYGEACEKNINDPVLIKTQISYAPLLSSNYQDGYFPASYCADGNTNNFCHANMQYFPYFEMNFGDETSIDEIVIYNRGDCCQDRIQDFYLLLKDSPFSTTWDEYTDGGTAQARRDQTISEAGWSIHVQALQSIYTIEIPSDQPSFQYARIILNGLNWLNLAEVQAFTTTVSTTPTCPNGCTSSNGICNNGVCSCVAGWSGLDCSVVVIPNPFPGLTCPLGEALCGGQCYKSSAFTCSSGSVSPKQDLGIDRAGLDLPNSPLTFPKGTPPSRCAYVCAHTIGCVSWASSIDCEDQFSCWLKSGVPQQQTQVCRASGVLTCPSGLTLCPGAGCYDSTTATCNASQGTITRNAQSSSS